MPGLFFVFLLACAGGAWQSLPLDPSRLREGLPAHRIRIGLHVDEAAALVTLPAGTRVHDREGRQITQLRRSGEVTVLPGGRDALLRDGSGRQIAHGAWLLLDPGDRGFSTKGNDYGGQLIVRRAARGITVINVVEVEQYLRGVVPWEIGRPDEDALEAVKAQAIAARTYTYAHLGHWEAQGFDAYDSVSDQVYRGLTGTHPLTDRAVAETRDKVLTYDGELIRAYYSSTCGGHGSRLQDVWTREPAPYLETGRDAPHPDSARSWCAESPHFRWSEAWSARELGEQIRKFLPEELRRSLDEEEIGTLEDLQVLERDRSGRVQRLLIVTDRDRFELWGDRIRWVLRPVHSRFGILRSTLFDVEPVRVHDRLVAVRLSGGGFGHGVGMCQTGALGMARAGQRVGAILEHYYAGARIADASSLFQLP